MSDPHMCRLLPTLEILHQELTYLGCDCKIFPSQEPIQLAGLHLYTGKGPLRQDILYLLPGGTGVDFPTGPYCCVTLGDRAVTAPGLHFQDRSFEDVYALLQGVFDKLQEYEAALNNLLFSAEDLQSLCRLASRMLENPVCIHDDWFQYLAMSDDFTDSIQPDYIEDTAQAMVPRRFVQALKSDPAYLETFEHTGAHLWAQTNLPDVSNCIYVNLRAGGLYKARLLCMEEHRPFRQLDYLLSDCISQRALLLLQQEQLSGLHTYRTMDNEMLQLLEGKTEPDPLRTPALLRRLGWQRRDQFMCIRLQSQNPAPTMTHYSVHTDLFADFPRSYIMFLDAQQCVVVDLTQEGITPADARHHISALCRDYGLYAGLSPRCNGLEDLPKAFLQAGVALDQAFHLRAEQWVIPFSSCALDYILRNLHTELPASHLIAPELLQLLEHDREKGTQYFQTLRLWLLCERNIPRTAQALIIHRTTLLYRLEKIQELVPMDLDNPNRRLYLLLSLRILEDETAHR